MKSFAVTSKAIKSSHQNIYFFQRIIILFAILLQTGCIIFPADKGTTESIHNGKPNGIALSDTVSDKQYVVEERHYTNTDIKYLFSPEGPIRKSLGPDSITHRYYLHNNISKTHLSNLDAYSEDEKWDQFFALGSQWYVINHHIKPRHLRLAVFSENNAPLIYEVDLKSGNTDVTLYLGSDKKSLLWKTKDAGLYRYIPGTDEEPASLSKSQYIELEQHATNLVTIKSVYDDIDFSSFKLHSCSAKQKKSGGGFRSMCSAYFETNLKYIKLYSRVHSYKIRWATAENPATPTDILETLSSDESEYVSKAALKNLRERGATIAEEDF